MHASQSNTIWHATIAGLILAVVLLAGGGNAAWADTSHLARYIERVPAPSLMPGADGYGSMHPDLPVAPVLRAGETVGWAFITSDFVGTTGYSGKPIHVMVAVDADAVVQGARLVDHAEPIVLIGIPEQRMRQVIEDYAGLDLKHEVAAERSAQEIDIIAGATVTVMVIDDSIIRSGIRVARAMGLGGLSPRRAEMAQRRELVTEIGEAQDWMFLLGDGSIRRMSLDIGQVNDAFERIGDPRATARHLEGPADDTFIDLYASLVSVPALGHSLLGEREHANLQRWLGDGEHAILVAGRGIYSFKGSGYVRGGLFDRIQLIQGDMSVRFRDRDHRRLGDIAASGAPRLAEIDLFRIPADSGFDPTQPWRLQLLVQRDVGATERLYTTFDLEYRLPDRFLTAPEAPAAVPAAMTIDEDEQAAKTALWQRIWREKTPEIAGLAVMLLVLTGAFFFQGTLTRSARVTFWFRIGFLTTTLFFLGWYANAQLSIVNLMALANSIATGFSWDAFLLDPLTFILWFSVAAALIFWGRGAYCGWLCPFGALQELTNRIAKTLRVPQWTVPWALHERLWALKYIIFLGLFGVTMASIGWGETLAEVEPFKTAIILKFDRAWPFVVYALVLLGIGLFVERFYCRYLCPLGAALAIPARIRMFDWLKRYRECGNPCQVCAKDCMVQAIHPTGEINPNECHNCLNCQVLYQSEAKCPVVILKKKKREAFEKRNVGTDAAIERALKESRSKEGVM
jgi:NosR/NirI family transcriptional regulator, nitrous oxide reductase regulator